MPRNGSGIQSSPAADYPAVADTLITATHFNNVIDDINTGITNSIAANGETTITANLPMNSKKFTGVANGSARTDSVTVGQVQDGTLNWVDGGGTADAITATYSPAITALVDGQICCVRATAANATTTPTFAPSGLTARTIVKTGGVALVAGDIVGDGHELLLRYLLASTRWELLNPAVNATALAGTFAALAGSASQAFAASTFNGNLTGNVTGNVTGNASGSSGSCTGNAAGLSATLGIATGGTGQTTALAAFTALAGVQSIGANGYAHIGGLLIQWGSAVSSGTAVGNTTVTFPVAFTTIYAVFGERISSGYGGQAAPASMSTSGATFTASTGSSGETGITVYWFAVGAP